MCEIPSSVCIFPFVDISPNFSDQFNEQFQKFLNTFVTIPTCCESFLIVDKILTFFYANGAVTEKFPTRKNEMVSGSDRKNSDLK